MTFKQRLIAFWNKIQKFILPFLSCVMLLTTSVLSASAYSWSIPINSLSCVCFDGEPINEYVATNVDVGGLWSGVISDHELVITSVDVLSPNVVNSRVYYPVVYTFITKETASYHVRVPFIDDPEKHYSFVFSSYFILNNSIQKKPLNGAAHVETLDSALTYDVYGAEVDATGPIVSHIQVTDVSYSCVRSTFGAQIGDTVELTIDFYYPTEPIPNWFESLTDDHQNPSTKWRAIYSVFQWYYTMPWVTWCLSLLLGAAVIALFLRLAK